MAIQRLDNVGIVVADMDAVVAFFTALGLHEVGRTAVSGSWVDATVGLDGVRSDIVLLATPDGVGKVELSRYRTPAALGNAPTSRPVNTVGLCRVMFAVDDIAATVAAVAPLGAHVLGEIARYDDAYLLCYVRGPEGIIVALAQQIG